MRKYLFLAIVPLMTSCASIESAELMSGSEVASANLSTTDGVAVGIATLSQRTDGLWLKVSADAPSVGIFGMHIHAVGRCDGPDFTTAGPHWNPGTKQHGRDNPLGAHAGDMPNVSTNSNGKLLLDVKIDGAMVSGAGGLLDSDGASLVIHEKADDYKTDPSGNSGKRIICGVFQTVN